MTVKTVVTTAVLIWLTAVPVAAQAMSTVGEFLLPWGGAYPSGFISMTSDGQTILFTDSPNNGICSSFPKQRLSVIRPDGSGHRVIVDWDVMVESWPDTYTSLNGLEISGDGSRAAFSWPSSFYSQDPYPCEPNGATEWNLVDMASGEVTPFRFNDKPVRGISFSDDGTRMAFRGWDPASRGWAYYLANPDGSEAIQFIAPSSWHGAYGVLSGDGNKYLFADAPLGQPGPGIYIFMHDFPSGVTHQINLRPIGFIPGLALSYDGSRIVHDDGMGSVIGVNGDGTEPHVIATHSGGGTTTISRDGEFAFYRMEVGNEYPFFRSRFDGSEQTRLPGWLNFHHLNRLPVSADGSLYAYYDQSASFKSPLGVWFEHTPMLTTYGLGTPGTPMTWDIGGEQGDTFLLALSLEALTPGAGTQFGRLELDPSNLILMASGTISGEQNNGSVTINIRPSLSIPDALPLHFQALVMSPETGEGKLTNRTTVVLHDDS